MTLDPDRTPVLVAVGQSESRDLLLGPLELAEQAACSALEAAPGLRRTIQRLTVVNILSRRAGPAPATELAAVLGLSPTTKETTNIGGNTPQLLVERAAADIAAGRLDSTLIVGSEAVRSGRLAPATLRPSSGSLPAEVPEPDPVYGIDRVDLSDEEHMAGFVIPIQVYPLFESALAHRAGRDPSQQRQFIGRMMAPFTEVASRHPHAWFREAQTPEQLATVGPDNRLVAEPYLKKMVAFLGGAQGAAVVVMSLALARSLSLDEGAIYVWSAASANEVWNPMARPDLARAAGLEAAAAHALEAAGVGTEEISLFDIYSCFPSAVQMGAAALGLPTDGRPDSPCLTVTGGLPYFGGPGNNYTSHAIATMFDRLRGELSSPTSVRGPLGLVNGVGWYMTKHSVGIYGTTPPPGGFKAADTRAAQDEINASAVPCVKAGEPLCGTAFVDASTVMYDREGRPTTASVVATMADGRRVAAAAENGDAAAFAGSFLVGASIQVESTAGAPTAPRYRLVD